MQGCDFASTKCGLELARKQRRTNMLMLSYFSQIKLIISMYITIFGVWSDRIYVWAGDCDNNKT